MLVKLLFKKVEKNIRENNQFFDERKNPFHLKKSILLGDSVVFEKRILQWIQ